MRAVDEGDDAARHVVLQREDAERGLGRRGERRADRVVVGLAGRTRAASAPRGGAGGAVRIDVLGAAPGGGELAPDDLQGRGAPRRPCCSRSCASRARAHARCARCGLHERGIDQLDGVGAGGLGLAFAGALASAAAGRPPPGSPRRRVGRWLSGSAWSELLCRGGRTAADRTSCRRSAKLGRRPAGRRAPGGESRGVRHPLPAANADPASGIAIGAGAGSRDDRRCGPCRCSASSATLWDALGHDRGVTVYMAFFVVRLGAVVGQGARRAALPARRAAPRRRARHVGDRPGLQRARGGVPPRRSRASSRTARPS